MLRQILALGVLASVATALPKGAMTWNEAVGADGVLFESSFDQIQSRSLDSAVIVAELSDLLKQDGVLDVVYNNYLVQYNKDQNRLSNTENREIFKQTLLEVAEHNWEAAQGKFEWTEGVNLFTDMTHDEQSGYRGYTMSFAEYFGNLSIPTINTKPNVKQEEPIDWVEQGKVSPVKQQGRCGSCYAFAAVGNLESMHAIATGDIADLSEQQVVDCINPRRDGCKGGGLGSTHDYLRNGVATEEDYPYTSGDTRKSGKCQKDAQSAGISVTGTRSFRGPDELQQALHDGPVTIAVCASCDGFSRYKSGILTKCSGRLDHAVLAVGFGEEDGTRFWKIKNSWGTNWGKEGGYIRILRDSSKNVAGVGGDCASMTSN